ncbi:electron transfer flavoprotein beta subunit lysine methyltransferase isoform X2 [Macaca nemestrina]|uniref:electron transfer flavoprotein beta subunit lysine methyltransferase isoform X2 n=1 Tax=Macaca nemestrina TaxID=9545 RepID=UPI0003ABC056|nr:electron transfer flavoprotein beta subunit lysine methyltransferase isoform X2 [Macaca mulatta]XP_045220924.1 electron transfer flavoprotein beta subunit lysine methyltransferase isoform X2 [Macaca fascicularis]
MALSLGWKAPRNGCGLLLQAMRSSGLLLFPCGRCPWRGAGSFLDPEIKAFLEENTEVTSSGSLTPEIQLRLLTPRCKFWWERADLWPHSDPYWAIYWPGGQALSRYLLDNPDVVRGKSVLDLGSGCGATAIAAKMSGASRILANDIDPNSLHQWLKKCFWTYRTRVLIGDPGRPQFSGHSIQHHLHKVVEYSLLEPTRQENSGLTTSTVWDFQP